MFSYEKEIEEILEESIFNDYELLTSMYQDDIKEILYNKEELNFLLRINYLLNLESSEITETIKHMKFNSLKIENDELKIPYWIQINYDTKTKKLIYKFFILWINENTDLINKIKEDLNSVEEPFIYNSIEILKDNLEDTLNNSNIISFLNEIKIKKSHNYSIENALLTITNANSDCPEFLYEEEKIENNEEKEINNPKKEEENKDLNKNKKTEYELFLDKGGIKSEILQEKDYAFQSHAIYVKSKEEVDLYKSYLLSNNKIKKAIRNVFAFRFMDEKSKNIIEDYDDDGEHYAGTRILGYLQKMKIYNILILVSRFNGDLHLKQHSTKYLTIAEILLKDNKNLFLFEK